MLNSSIKRADSSPSQTVLTSNHHHGHGEDLLSVGGGGDVPEADGGQAGHGEVQRRDVERVLPGAALPSARAAGIVPIRRADTEGQLVQPAVHLYGVGGLVDHLVVSDTVPGKQLKLFFFLLYRVSQTSPSWDPYLKRSK